MTCVCIASLHRKYVHKESGKQIAQKTAIECSHIELRVITQIAIDNVLFRKCILYLLIMFIVLNKINLSTFDLVFVRNARLADRAHSAASDDNRDRNKKAKVLYCVIERSALHCEPVSSVEEESDQ